MFRNMVIFSGYTDLWSLFCKFRVYKCQQNLAMIVCITIKEHNSAEMFETIAKHAKCIWLLMYQSVRDYDHKNQESLVIHLNLLFSSTIVLRVCVTEGQKR